MNEHALPTRRTGVASREVAEETAAPRYWAFISYSHADSAVADRLHKRLETFRIPRKLIGTWHPFGTIPAKLTPIFRDRQELAASSDLGRNIELSLADSRYLIVICSPSAARSRWVDQEIRDFKRFHGEDHVLAVIVAGEPFSADEAQECFPPSLRFKVDKSGNRTAGPAEPIAADLRDSGDGQRLGTLKIIAGLLNVGLDDLVQRDQHRRQKRMTWIAAASLAGMAFTTSMSVVALDARDTARDERRAAEGLVSFMLGDLKNELQPIGRLAALDKVGARALAFYERQDQKKLTDDQLTQRSRALTLLGQIATDRGDTDAALARYLEARRGTAELVGRYPDDPEKLFDHAQNVFYVGDLMVKRGDLAAGERSYRDYKSLAERMIAADPNNPRWLMERLYANENIGIILYYQRRFAEAAKQFGAAVPAMEAITAKDPRNLDYKKELSNILAWLGDSRRDEGKLDQAISARTKQIVYLQDEKAARASDVRLQEALIPARLALSILLGDKGNTARSVEELRTALREVEVLTSLEPDNATYKGFAASAQLALAESLLSLGSPSEAMTHAQTGCALASDLRRRDPRLALWHGIETDCFLSRAKLALRNGAPAEALAFARRAIASAKGERSADRIADAYGIAAAYRTLGDVQQAMGDRVAARRSWAAGLDLLGAEVTERPREMLERAALLSRLGRKSEARPLLETLRESGFRRSN